ncbi:glycosyltransferase [Mangrovibacterium diazotrophicum]|uniref:Glycosyltransferase involved in cell wall biosynthesis n=1 Tax=Mangrovibacterium diazotrophicum TaxID=1261403 RepID=A0A419VW21_9BACT|nr:glycosyltransferase [Mangrovibacterium diazotrophicum]RKD86354.1 glycosyltransferase involved in cell wall biosynthesis [Mangrovibacterium diazotrophicum]
MSKKILFLSPLPPPIYGSNLSCQTCLEVIQESKTFEIQNIKLNKSVRFDEVGKLTGKKLIASLGLTWQIVKTVRKFKPDLVYLMPSTAGVAFYRDFGSALVLKLMKQKIVYHVRTHINDDDIENKVRFFYFKNAFKNSTVIVLGQELKTALVNFTSSEKVKILPNAIAKSVSDIEYRKIEAERLKFKTLNLLFLSNMMRDKGWLKALKVAKLLKDADADFHFRFAGSWPSHSEETEFYKFLNRHQLNDCVSYIGFVDGNRKREILAKSDLLIFPTEYRHEALPRVIIEAMEFGIPVIANSIAAIPSTIVDNYTGFLLTENTPEEIISKLEYFNSKEVIGVMGSCARKRYLDYYELEGFKEKFIGIIEKC